MRVALKFDDFEIRYKQVLYDNRYHFVYYQGQEVMKISMSIVNRHNYRLFWEGFTRSAGELGEAKIADYFKRVEQKDALLNRS